MLLSACIWSTENKPLVPHYSMLLGAEPNFNILHSLTDPQKVEIRANERCFYPISGMKLIVLALF